MVLFDLDDTLLWDKKKCQGCFQFDVSACGKGSRDLARGIRKKMFAIEPENCMLLIRLIHIRKKIGINPFEGLWATFDDPGEEFQQLRDIAPVYQEKAWRAGLEDTGVNNPKLAKKLAKAFRTYRIESPCLFEDALTVLTELEKDYRLALVTNGSPSLQNLKLEISPELIPYFEKIFISGDIGTGKPDPEIFNVVLKALDIKAEDAIMVGDNLNTDIIGANRTGIESVWLNRFDAENNSAVEPDFEIKSLKELKNILQTYS